MIIKEWLQKNHVRATAIVTKEMSEKGLDTAWVKHFKVWLFRHYWHMSQYDERMVAGIIKLKFAERHARPVSGGKGRL